MTPPTTPTTTGTAPAGGPVGGATPAGTGPGPSVTARSRSGHSRRHPFVLYGTALGAVLMGYLLFDRAFAYLHPPGVPLFVGEIVLLLGVGAALRSTGMFRRSVAAEPVLALLVAFVAWGALRSLPGVATHGLDAVRDAALWYYAAFALLAPAAVAANPDLPRLWASWLARWSPLVLLWLAASVVL